MKLTAIIYPDSETDLLVAECPEIGTAQLARGHRPLPRIIPASRQEAGGDPHF